MKTVVYFQRRKLKHTVRVVLGLAQAVEAAEPRPQGTRQIRAKALTGFHKQARPRF